MKPCRYQFFVVVFDDIFHLDVHYVCMLVQCFEPQGRRFTNFHYYYCVLILQERSGPCSVSNNYISTKYTTCLFLTDILVGKK